MRIFVALNIVTAHWYRFYANTVIIFLKPFGLFRLSSPPALGEGSRRLFADFIILRSPACSGSSTAQVHVPVPVHHDRPHRLQKSAARVVPPARKTGQMMTVMENARTTPRKSFPDHAPQQHQTSVTTSFRPWREYETQGQSAPEQNMSGIPVPVVLPHVPAGGCISALSAWFSDDAAHLHEKERTGTDDARIGWQGKNTDFTKTFNQFIHGSQPQETVAMKFLLRQRRSKKRRSVSEIRRLPFRQRKKALA